MTFRLLLLQLIVYEDQANEALFNVARLEYP